MTKRALYLAGGGARGAYQVGVLKAINHILQVKTLPFYMVTGVSVGSINAAILAECADDFNHGVQKLEELWGNISSQDVFYASNYALGKSLIVNASQLFLKQRQQGFFLDSTPLKELIHKTVQFEKIDKHIADKTIEVVEVISHCYDTQQTVSFYQYHAAFFEDWAYPRHISQRVSLKPEHILASSALPLFFPSVCIDNIHYGDGSVGLVAPLRGGIRFQVEKILILGTRSLPTFKNIEEQRQNISLAHILGSMLNGIFLDNLDRDIEMVNRMNDIARLLSLWKKRYSPWRPIQTLHLRPSIDVSSIAQAQYHTMPGLLQFMLNILGAKSRSGDLLSFLLFEKAFARELMRLGYDDTMAVKEDIETFFG